MSHGDAPDGSMTLAFTLDALAAFAHPTRVVGEARAWSRYVGVVGEDPAEVAAYVARHGIQQDYELGNAEPYAVLSKLRWEAGTDRYVLVGADEGAEDLADYVGWEYVPVRDAARTADWTLADEAGVLSRVRSRLARFAPARE